MMKRTLTVFAALLALFLFFDNGLQAKPRLNERLGEGDSFPTFQRPAQPPALETGTVVSVMDHGAVGDGVADDWQAFVDAFDALPAQGGTVFVPCGNYRLLSVGSFYSKSIQITEDNWHLLGNGECSNILHDFPDGAHATNSDGVAVVICSNPVHACCEDLDGDGDCDSGTFEGASTDFRVIKNISVRSLSFGDPDTVSCAGYDPDFETCTGEESHGISTANAKNLIFSQLWFDDLGDEALAIGRSDNFLVENIVCRNVPSIPAGGSCVNIASSHTGIINHIRHTDTTRAPNGDCTDAGGCPNSGKIVSLESFSATRSLHDIWITDLFMDTETNQAIGLTSNFVLENVLIRGARLFVDNKDVTTSIDISGLGSVNSIWFDDLYTESGIDFRTSEPPIDIHIRNAEIRERLGDEDAAFFTGNKGIVVGNVDGLFIEDTLISGFEAECIFIEGTSRNINVTNTVIEECGWGGVNAVGFFGTNTSPPVTFDNVTFHGVIPSADCTSLGQPARCCTGSGTGCDTRPTGEAHAVECTAAGVPESCCTGNNAGCDSSLSEGLNLLVFALEAEGTVLNSTFTGANAEAVTGGWKTIRNSEAFGYGINGSGVQAFSTSVPNSIITDSLVIGKATGSGECVRMDAAGMVLRDTTLQDCGNSNFARNISGDLLCQDNVALRDGLNPSFNCTVETDNQEINY